MCHTLLLMDKPELAQQALACYDRLLQRDQRLRPRPGQRLMAEQVAQTFSQADLGPLCFLRKLFCFWLVSDNDCSLC